MNIEYSIVSAAIFKKLYPPPITKPQESSSATAPGGYTDISSGLENIKCYSDIYNEWLTMEATLPPCKPSDCQGHFYDNPCLPHSVMCFHNIDLLGKAISEFTGRDVPFKRTDFGQEHGIKMLSWVVCVAQFSLCSLVIKMDILKCSRDCIYSFSCQCSPENLHFPDTYGLKLQSKVMLDKGVLGEPGSKYSVQLMVKQEETGIICYRAKASFILEPIRFLRTELRQAIANQDFDTLWDQLDSNRE